MHKVVYIGKSRDRQKYSIDRAWMLRVVLPILANDHIQIERRIDIKHR
jgi:hypothetical protein